MLIKPIVWELNWLQVYNGTLCAIETHLGRNALAYFFKGSSQQMRLCRNNEF
jgi:hypothetical protein